MMWVVPFNDLKHEDPSWVLEKLRRIPTGPDLIFSMKDTINSYHADFYMSGIAIGSAKYNYGDRSPAKSAIQKSIMAAAESCVKWKR